MEKLNEICLSIIFKAEAMVGMLQKTTVRKLNLHNNVLTKLHAVCVKMFLKDCLAWLALGTQLIGSRLTTAT